MTDPLLRYHELLAEVAAAMAPLLVRHRAALRCAPGCADCCQTLSLLPIEAQVVAEAFAGRPAREQGMIRRQAKHPAGRCPFLLDRRCAIYPARPLICRTHGLAIGYVDEERGVIEVSACPCNFPEESPLNADDLLFLDPFNARLAALNREYAVALALDPALRIEMTGIILAAPEP